MRKIIFGSILLCIVIISIRLVAHKTKTITSLKPGGSVNVESPRKPSLNGTLVAGEQELPRPIAVMVENHPDARPQAGLADADLVYEALAEGGITRFMAVYQLGHPGNIGPVRSARTYYADIANELGAVYAHVGGNSDVLANIKAGLYPNISDADQFFNDAYFHRIKTRYAPHNVYTSVTSLENLAADHHFSNQVIYEPWIFKSDSPASSSAASVITVSFSTAEYAVDWKYNAVKNTYNRFLAGNAHIDADSGKQITAKDVIVQYVKTWSVVSDTVGALGMDLQSGGDAVVFLDGRVVLATWKKNNGRTRYYDLQQNEIALSPGNMWIELVPVQRPVQWK